MKVAGLRDIAVRTEFHEHRYRPQRWRLIWCGGQLRLKVGVGRVEIVPACHVTERILPTFTRRLISTPRLRVVDKEAATGIVASDCCLEDDAVIDGDALNVRLRPETQRKHLADVGAVGDGDSVEKEGESAKPNVITPVGIALNCALLEVAVPLACRGQFDGATGVDQRAHFARLITLNELLKRDALRALAGDFAKHYL